MKIKLNKLPIENEMIDIQKHMRSLKKQLTLENSKSNKLKSEILQIETGRKAEAASLLKKQQEEMLMKNKMRKELDKL